MNLFVYVTWKIFLIFEEYFSQGTCAETCGASWIWLLFVIRHKIRFLHHNCNGSNNFFNRQSSEPAMPNFKWYPKLVTCSDLECRETFSSSELALISSKIYCYTMYNVQCFFVQCFLCKDGHKLELQKHVLINVITNGKHNIIYF